MGSLLGQPVFQLYTVSSAILVVILYWLAFLTAGVRGKRKKILNAEDVKVNSGAELVETEHPDVARIQRAHRNSLENAVPFFIVGGLYTLTDPSLRMAQGLFVSFVALRVFHALFYLKAKQPFRTLSFALGAVVNLVMLEEVLRAML